MTTKRKIEIFSAGCPICQEAIELVKNTDCCCCEIEVLDMHDQAVATKAKQYQIHRVPAVVINGQQANCCTQQGLDEASLQTAIGTPLK